MTAAQSRLLFTHDPPFSRIRCGTSEEVAMPKLPSFLVLAAALLCPSLPSGARCALADTGRPAAPETAPTLAGAGGTDTHDVSPEREERYTRSVRQWLDSLPAEQQKQARKILRDAHPGLHELRVRIREKTTALAELRFSSATPPDTLPRLGQELQRLRAQLRRRLHTVNERLRHEVGVPMGPLGEDGLWLTPLPDDPASGTGSGQIPGKPADTATQLPRPGRS